MRILIADQQSKVRFALRVLLQNQQGYPVVGDAESAQELLTRIEYLSPDVLLLDSSLPGLPLPDLVQAVQQLSPQTRTMIMGTNPDIQADLPSLGIEDYVSKNEAPTHLLETLRRCSLSPSIH